MHHPSTARREAAPTGVIETLSAGYAALNRQLWVLLLPVLLNLFLWLGPHVSFSPLVGPLATRASEWTRQVGVGPRRGLGDPQLQSSIDQTRQWLIAASDEINGFEALVWTPLGVPTLVGLPSTNEDLAFVSGWADGVALFGACVALGLLVGGVFYGGLADASVGQRGGPLSAGRRVPRAVVDVVGLVALLFGVALLLGLPVLLLIAFTALASPPVAVLGTLLLGAGLLYASVHLFFSIPAIFVSNAGPLRAIQRSIAVVRRHLWPSLALMVLTWLILAGMGRVWDLLAVNLQSPYGVVLGILGNAYIASGLVAAGMVFYIQRSEQTHSGTSR
ncbi:MAG: hypothetical protein JOZ81_34845 [Chloroflexi bacterium]|nr:hypothetical protein [Chloroflexota bacterium]